MVCRADFVQLRRGVAVIEVDLVFLAAALHVHLDAGRKRIHDRNADAMKATGNLVTLAAEFAAGMQNGENDLNRRNLFLGVHIDRNATAVIGNGNRVIGMDPNLDVVAVTRKRFVDGVVDDFVHKMMKAARAGRSNVHTRTLAYRFEAFEDLNVRAIVMIGFLNH